MNTNYLNSDKIEPIPPGLARTDVELLSCFGYLDTRSNVPFDYYRYYEFQLGASEKEKYHRLNDILNEEKIKECQEFTVVDFEQEFYQLYGPMNKLNNKYKLLLKEYKKSRIEEMQDWAKKEKNTKLFVIQNDADDKQKTEELIKSNQVEIKLIDAQFTSQEIEQFSDLSVKYGPNKGHEWFLFPRPKFPRKTKTFSWNLGKKNKNTKIPKVNLAVLDPLIEFPDVIRGGIEFRILVTMRKLLNKYPMGICTQDFMKEYEKQLGYVPDLSTFGFSNIHKFIDYYPDVFWIQEIEDIDGNFHSKILFPTYLRGFSCPIRATLLRIFHQIQLLLFLNGGTIKSNELFDKMKKMYCGKNFISDIKHWGFENIETFLEFLINNFKEVAGPIKLIKDPELSRKGDQTKYLLRIHKGNEKLIKLSEDYFAPKIKPINGIIYSIYVSKSESYIYESEYILPGTILKGTLPFEIFNPTKFYLIKNVEAWDNVKQLMKDIKIHFKDLDSNRAKSDKSIAKLENLRRGSPVAAYQPEYDEWHRSKVSYIDTKRNIVNVFSVDMASHWTITLDQIKKKYLRYLPKKFFTMKAQAIGCSLQFGKYSESILKLTEKKSVKGDKTQTQFKKPYNDCFINIMQEKMFETTFIKKLNPGLGFWEVSLAIEYVCNDRGKFVRPIIETGHNSRDSICVAAKFIYSSLRVLLELEAGEESKSLELNQNQNVENDEKKEETGTQVQTQTEDKTTNCK